MNKKIVLSAVLALFVATTSLLAQPKCGMQNSNKDSRPMMQCKTNYRGHQVIKMFMQLDLTQAQRETIRNIMRTNMQKSPRSSSAFTDSSFDKENYIAILQARQSTRVERKAQMIADIYATLTPAQKKDFKTMLDMKEIMLKKRVMK